MIFHLPDDLSQYDKYLRKPFSIFEKKNFLDNKFYFDLKKSFPSNKYFIRKSNEGKKLSFDNRDHIFFDFLDQNDCWKEFYSQVNNKIFVKYFFELIKEDLNEINERMNIKKVYFNEKYSENFFNRLLRKIIRLNYTNIRLGFQFSKIKMGCYIPPHCDVSNKLLSLMLYFPDDSSTKIDKLGTNFFKIINKNKKNFDNWDSKLMSDDEAQIFFENYEKFYTSNFDNNKLVGFIKNDKSWHGVEKILDNIERNSININLYIV